MNEVVKMMKVFFYCIDTFKYFYVPFCAYKQNHCEFAFIVIVKYTFEKQFNKLKLYENSEHLRTLVKFLNH